MDTPTAPSWPSTWTPYTRFPDASIRSIVCLVPASDKEPYEGLFSDAYVIDCPEGVSWERAVDWKGVLDPGNEVAAWFPLPPYPGHRIGRPPVFEPTLWDWFEKWGVPFEHPIRKAVVCILGTLLFGIALTGALLAIGIAGRVISWAWIWTSSCFG